MSWQGALTQGASGAATGSMFGPWGTVIGGGIGLAMGAMQDDSPAVDVQKLLGKDLTTLRSRSAQQHQLGSQLLGQGQDAMGPVLNYYKGLLSGNPTEVLAATAPDRGRVIDQYDTARRAMAMGPRGGGTTSAQAQSQVAQANDLQEILATARDKGAEGASMVGAQLLSSGTQLESLSTQSLDQVINAVLAGAGLDIRQQENIQAQQAAQGEALGSMIGLLLTKKYGAGGGAGAGKVGTAGIGGAIQPNPYAGF